MIASPGGGLTSSLGRAYSWFENQQKRRRVGFCSERVQRTASAQGMVATAILLVVGDDARRDGSDRRFNVLVTTTAPVSLGRARRDISSCLTPKPESSSRISSGSCIEPPLARKSKQRQAQRPEGCGDSSNDVQSLLCSADAAPSFFLLLLFYLFLFLSFGVARALGLGSTRRGGLRWAGKGSLEVVDGPDEASNGWTVGWYVDGKDLSTVQDWVKDSVEKRDARWTRAWP